MAIRQRGVTFNGLIMYRQNYREHDLLVKILTDKFGKRMFLVRGGTRPRFKLAAALLPFTYGLYVGDLQDDGLSYITTARDYHQYQSISQDIFLNAYATYIFDLIDHAFSDNFAIPQWYQKTADALHMIDEGFDGEVISDIMAVQLLPAFGVAPEWRGCVVCGCSDLPMDFSETEGGMLCQKHWALDPHRLHVSPRGIYYLRLFSIVDLLKINSIKLQPATKAELAHVIDRIYDDMVGLNLKSKQFIANMNQWEDKLKPGFDK